MIILKELLTEDLYPYFYHATTPDALPGIVEKGLIPSTETHWGGELEKFSLGKIFIADRFYTANYYGNMIWRNEPNRYRPILKFKYNKHRIVRDKLALHDFYLEYPIKPRFELFIYDQDTIIKYDQSTGDTWFDEKTGHWRPLTHDLATMISSGEWDGEDPSEMDDEEGK